MTAVSRFDVITRRYAIILRMLLPDFARFRYDIGVAVGHARRVESTQISPLITVLRDLTGLSRAAGLARGLQ